MGGRSAGDVREDTREHERIREIWGNWGAAGWVDVLQGMCERIRENTREYERLGGAAGPLARGMEGAKDVLWRLRGPGPVAEGWQFAHRL